MKKCLSIVFFHLFVVCLIFSQDVITKRTGEDISAKVLEVGQTEIKYKKFDNLDGPSFIISKSDVLMIRYSNGTKDIFEAVKNSAVETQPANMCDQAKKDATTNYLGQKAGAGWTCATTILFSPLIGVVPALACSSSAPKDENLNYKNSDLMNNADYNKCYRNQAHKIKKKNIWTAYGIGAGAWVLILSLLNADD